LAVSDFRLRARLGFSIPSPSRPARSYPRLWIRRSSFERRSDLNPPESRAAQRTVRFVDSPGAVRMPELAAQLLVQNGSIALNPAPDGDVVHRKPAFCHHFFQIAVAKGIAQIPTNAQNDENIFEVPSPEQPRSIVGHCLNLSKFPARVCNRSEPRGNGSFVSDIVRFNLSSPTPVAPVASYSTRTTPAVVKILPTLVFVQLITRTS